MTSDLDRTCETVMEYHRADTMTRSWSGTRVGRRGLQKSDPDGRPRSNCAGTVDDPRKNCRGRWEAMMSKVVRVATFLAAVFVVTTCTSGSPRTPASSPSAGPSIETSSSPLASAIASATAATPAATVAASASAGPTSFTSKIYGYSLTVPAGWTANPSLHGVGRQRGTGS